MEEGRSSGGGAAGERATPSRPGSNSSATTQGSLTYEIGPGLAYSQQQAAAVGLVANPLLQGQYQQPVVHHNVLYPQTAPASLGSSASTAQGSGMASRRGQNSYRMHSAAAEPYCAADDSVDSDLTAEELQLYREEQYWEAVRLAQWQQHQHQQQQRRLGQQQQQQQHKNPYSHYHDPTAGVYNSSSKGRSKGYYGNSPHLSPQRSLSGSFLRRYSTIRRCMLGLLLLAVVAVCEPCILHVRSGHVQHVTQSTAGVITQQQVTLAHIGRDAAGAMPADGSSGSGVKHSKWTLKSLWCRLSSSALTCSGAWSCSSINGQTQLQQTQLQLQQQPSPTQVQVQANQQQQQQQQHSSSQEQHHGGQPTLLQQGSTILAQPVQNHHQQQQDISKAVGTHTVVTPPLTFSPSSRSAPLLADHPLANSTRFLSLFYTSILPALLQTPWSEVHHAGADKALTAAAGLLVRLSSEPGYEGLTHVDMGEQGMDVNSRDAQIPKVKQGPHKGFHALPSLTAAALEFSKPLGTPLPSTPQLLELVLQGMWEAQASSCLGAAKSLPERKAPPQPFNALRSIVLRNQFIQIRAQQQQQQLVPRTTPVRLSPQGGVFHESCSSVKLNASEIAVNDPRMQCLPCDKCDTQGFKEAERQLLSGFRGARGRVDAAWNVTVIHASVTSGPASLAQALEHVNAVDLERTAFPVTRRVLLATLHLVSTALQQQAVQVQPLAGSTAATAGGLLENGVGAQTAAATATSSEAQPTAPELLSAVEAAGREVVTAAQSAERCAAEQRPVTEMLHVSKSGGSSMCELARLAGKKSPFFNIKQNCMVPSFGDSPRWIVKAPSFMPPQCTTSASGWLVSQQKCPDWLAPHRTVTCRLRSMQAQRLGADFYMNEAFIHESQAGDPSAARTCGEFRSLVVLREPIARIASHVAHLRRLMETEMHDYCYLRILGKPLASSPEWSTPGDLKYWAGFAPEVMDNYVLRHLMGKHGRCMFDTRGPQSAFDATHYAHGLAKLVSFDNVMTLDDSAANSEIIFKLGLGWGYTTQDVAYRINNASHHVEEDMGFPKGSLKAIQDLNRWDRGLYRLGSQVAALDAAYLATAYSLGLRDVAGQGASVKLVHPGAPSSAAATGGAGSSSSLLSLSGSAAAAGGASADAGAATGTALGAQVGSQQQQPGSEQQGTAAKPQSQSQHQEGKEAVQQGHPGQQQQQTPGAASGQVSEGESATELAVQRRHLMQEPDQQQQQQQQQQQSIGEGDQNEVDVISGTALAEQRRSLKQQSLRVQRQSLAGVRDFVQRTRNHQAASTALVLASRGSGKVLPRAVQVETQVSSTHTPVQAVQEPQEKDLSFIKRTDGHIQRRVLLIDERLVLFSAAAYRRSIASSSMPSSKATASLAAAAA